MATKQTQNIKDYIFEIPMEGVGNIMPNMVSIVSDAYMPNGERTICRLSTDDLFTIGKEYNGVLTTDNIETFLDDKYLAISEEAMGKCVSFDTVYSTDNSRNRGVYFDAGITLTYDPVTSWMGWGSINPSLYGNTTSNMKPCNVFKGTFSMNEVYIDELWVKNLHTADSSGGSSSGEGENYLTKETYTDEAYNCECIGIGVDRIKSVSGGTRGVAFPNGISLCERDITDSWIGYWQVKPTDYGFTDNTAIPSNVCYGTFGMETVYMSDLYVRNLHTPDFDLNDKIKALEARIAALESK